MVQVARGRLSKQIAHDIGIAEAAVKEHRSRAMQKMKAGSLPELGRMADKSSWCRHAATLLSCALCATRYFARSDLSGASVIVPAIHGPSGGRVRRVCKSRLR
jgi:hypothetical protein